MKRMLWRNLIHQRKKEICIILASVLLIEAGWCGYEYTQWKRWNHANKTVQAYSLTPLPSRTVWESSSIELMSIVQRQCEIYGLQILSFQATQHDGRHYILELQGNYESYVHFLNKIEEMMPFTMIEIVQMERSEKQIVCKVRI